jgi:P-type Ca2+ transporter type 2C
VLFTTLTLLQMGMAEAIRFDRDSLFRIGLLSNKPLLRAVMLTFGLQMAVIYIPILQIMFQITYLSAIDLLITLSLSIAILGRSN